MPEFDSEHDVMLVADVDDHNVMIMVKGDGDVWVSLDGGGITKVSSETSPKVYPLRWWEPGG